MGTTGQGYQNLLDTFGWAGNSPAISFTMMPLYADLLKVQAIEMNDTIRKSAYSFELINNKLRLFPRPSSAMKVWFQYIVKADRWKTLTYTVSGSTGTTQGGKTSVQSDFSNIRYDNMAYTDINDVGKQWIRKYTLALAKELLGIIRSKYGSIPIPGGDVSMDGDTLRSEASAEKDTLVTQLREMLEQTSGDEILQEEAAESDHTQEILKKVPMKIYIG